VAPLLQLLLVLVIIIFAAKLAGHLSVRFGQPMVLGEILIGLILGPTLLNVVGHLEILAGTALGGEQTRLMATVEDLAHVGVIFLMFMAGMETNLKQLMSVGVTAFWAAIGGLVLPMALGFGAAMVFFQFDMAYLYPALFVGVILTATSVSISAQTLMELGQLKSKEGGTIIGAAVIDDVIGIIILSFVIAFKPAVTPPDKSHVETEIPWDHMVVEASHGGHTEHRHTLVDNIMAWLTDGHSETEIIHLKEEQAFIKSQIAALTHPAEFRAALDNGETMHDQFAGVMGFLEEMHIVEKPETEEAAAGEGGEEHQITPHEKELAMLAVRLSMTPMIEYQGLDAAELEKEVEHLGEKISTAEAKLKEASWGMIRIGILVTLMIVFFVVFMFVGFKYFEKWMAGLSGIHSTETVLAFAIAIGLGYAWAAEFIGSVAAITGSYMAGLIFAQTGFKHTIEEKMHTVTYSLFVPIFFISIGLMADARPIFAPLFGHGQMSLFWYAVAICILAVIGKVAGCWAGARATGFDNKESMRVGMGMVSRGEVGLIVAGVGLTAGVIATEQFSVMILMVLFTTLVTPILLKVSFPKIEDPRVLNDELGESDSLAQ
jgi:Kef-type K+ transport system membrane component KefB